MRIKNTILLLGVSLIVLRLFFPVLKCAAPDVVRFCSGGRIINFSIEAPPFKEHISSPNVYDGTVGLWTLQEVARLRGKTPSPYVVDNSRTYAQAVAIAFIAGILYFMLKRKDGGAHIQRDVGNQKRGGGFLQKFESFFSKREAESAYDFKNQPLRWTVIKTLVVPVVALGVMVGGGSPEMAIMLTGIVFVVTMNRVHAILKSSQLDERRKKIVGFILLGSVVFAILIIALFYKR